MVPRSRVPPWVLLPWLFHSQIRANLRGHEAASHREIYHFVRADCLSASRGLRRRFLRPFGAPLQAELAAVDADRFLRTCWYLVVWAVGKAQIQHGGVTAG